MGAVAMFEWGETGGGWAEKPLILYIHQTLHLGGHDSWSEKTKKLQKQKKIGKSNENEQLLGGV